MASKIIKTGFVKLRLQMLLTVNDLKLDDLADLLNITYQTLSKKMNEHVDFTRTEIRLIKDRFNLTPDQVENIFFNDQPTEI